MIGDDGGTEAMTRVRCENEDRELQVILENNPNLLPGDFNFDGVVDAADFVVWRKTRGPASDYDLWRTHMGQSLPPSGVAQSAAVPEPSSLVLLVALIGLAPCVARR